MAEEHTIDRKKAIEDSDTCLPPTREAPCTSAPEPGEPGNLENTSSEKLCPRCGNSTEVSARFCNKCGYSFDVTPAKRKRKHSMTALVGIILIAGIVVCGLFTFGHIKAEQQRQHQAAVEKARQEQIAAHIEKTRECYDAIGKAESNFEHLAYMYDLALSMDTGFWGPSYLVDYVRGLTATEISSEKARKSTVETIKAELDDLNCDETDVEDIKQAIEHFCSVYEERYKLLIEGDFSIANFTLLNQSSKRAYDEAKKKVKDALDAFETDESTDQSSSEAALEKEAT